MDSEQGHAVKGESAEELLDLSLTDQSGLSDAGSLRY